MLPQCSWTSNIFFHLLMPLNYRSFLARIPCTFRIPWKEDNREEDIGKKKLYFS